MAGRGGQRRIHALDPARHPPGSQLDDADAKARETLQHASEDEGGEEDLGGQVEGGDVEGPKAPRSPTESGRAAFTIRPRPPPVARDVAGHLRVVGRRLAHQLLLGLAEVGPGQGREVTHDHLLPYFLVVHGHEGPSHVVGCHCLSVPSSASGRFSLSTATRSG